MYAAIPSGTADEGTKKRFSEAMDNDLGTPDALAVVFESINAEMLYDSQDLDGAGSYGYSHRIIRSSWTCQVKKDSNVEIEELIRRREVSRQEKDFEEADRIRDELHSQGVEIEDTPTGTLWRYR